MVCAGLTTNNYQEFCIEMFIETILSTKEFYLLLLLVPPTCHEDNVERVELGQDVLQSAGDPRAVLHHQPGQVPGKHQCLAQPGQLRLLLVPGEGGGDDEHLHLLLLLHLLPDQGGGAGM